MDSMPAAEAAAPPDPADGSSNAPESTAACHPDAQASFSGIRDALQSIWASDIPPPECRSEAIDDSSLDSSGSLDALGAGLIHGISAVEEGMGSNKWACVDGGVSWRSKARFSASLLGRVAVWEAACGAQTLISLLQDLVQLLHSASLDIHQRIINASQHAHALVKRVRHEDPAQVARQVVADLKTAAVRKVEALHDLAAPLYAQSVRQIQAGWAVAVQVPRQVLAQVKTGLGWIPEDLDDESSDDMIQAAENFDYDDSWVPEPASVGPEGETYDLAPDLSPEQSLQLDPAAGQQHWDLTAGPGEDPHDGIVAEQEPASVHEASEDAIRQGMGQPHEATQNAEVAGTMHGPQDPQSWAGNVESAARMPESNNDSVLLTDAVGIAASEGTVHLPSDNLNPAQLEMPGASFQDSLLHSAQQLTDAVAGSRAAPFEHLESFEQAPQPDAALAFADWHPHQPDPEADKAGSQDSRSDMRNEPIGESSNDSSDDLAWLAAHEASLVQAITHQEQQPTSDTQLRGSEPPANSAQLDAGNATPALPISPPSTSASTPGQVKSTVFNVDEADTKLRPAATIQGNVGLQAEQRKSEQPECGLTGGSRDCRMGSGHAGVDFLRQMVRSAVVALEPSANYFEVMVGMHASSLIWILGTIIAAGTSMALVSHLTNRTPVGQTQQNPQAVLPRNGAGAASSAARSAISLGGTSASAHGLREDGAQQAASAGQPSDLARPGSAQPSGSVQPSTLSGAIAFNADETAQQVP